MMYVKKIIVFILVWSIFFSVLSCGGRKYRKRRTRKKQGIYHSVQKGQTLWRIAKTYNINLKILKRVNNLSDVTKIKVGQKIFIPGATRRKQVAVVKPLEVKKGAKKARDEKLSFIWPIKGKLTSSFGMRKKRKHDGIDIAASKGGHIKASASGKVIFSGWGPTGYGKIVIIKHSDEFVTVYAHNQKNMVKKGEYVQKGAPIAQVGTTGRTTGPHVHFEVRKNRVPQDPLLYLP